MVDANWVPPDELATDHIPISAIHDYYHGRYEEALQKLVWFYHHAPAVYGSRSSLLFRSWLKLGKVYPPAYGEYIRIRDETESRFRNDFSNRDLFEEIRKLNHRLSEGERTIRLFEEVRQQDFGIARELYPIIQTDLIHFQRFHLCGRFLDPEKMFKDLAKCYATIKQFEELQERHAGIEDLVPQTARVSFVEETANLVALLARNNRTIEAEKVRRWATTVIDDVDFVSTLDAAMTGEFPKQDY